MGDSVERDWVEALLHIVAGKAVAFLKPGFTQHPTNWVLAYDNWQLSLPFIPSCLPTTAWLSGTDIILSQWIL